MELRSRKNLPQFLNSLSLNGVGVEVGVFRGDFSKLFFDDWHGTTYHMVDPYQNQGNPLDRSDVSQEEHDANFEFTSKLVRAANERKNSLGPRIRLHREFSVEKAKQIMWNSVVVCNTPVQVVDCLDFVYIDARHDYRSVWADLEAWYPLVKSGGVFAGHDYKNSFVRKNLVEVKRAVDDFFYNKEKVKSTIDDNLPTWYIIKK